MKSKKPRIDIDAQFEHVLHEYAESIRASSDGIAFHREERSRAKRMMADPNTAGWQRLFGILYHAKKDECVLASPSASEFLDMVLTLTKITRFEILGRNAETDGELSGIKALRPLLPVLTGDQLKDNTGRLKGRDTMKQRKEAHIEHLRKPVIDLLKNPQTFDWTDPEIARWLMKPERAYHERKGKKPLGLKTMIGRVAKIRATYKASI